MLTYNVSKSQHTLQPQVSFSCSFISCIFHFFLPFLYFFHFWCPPIASHHYSSQPAAHLTLTFNICMMKPIYQLHTHTLNFKHHKSDKNNSITPTHSTLSQSILHLGNRNKLNSTTANIPHTSKHTETLHLYTSNKT